MKDINKYIKEIIVTGGYHGDKKDYPKPLRQDQWVKSYCRITGLMGMENKEYQEILSKIDEHSRDPSYPSKGWKEKEKKLRDERDEIDDQISERSVKVMDEIVELLKENRRKLKESEREVN